MLELLFLILAASAVLAAAAAVPAQSRGRSKAPMGDIGAQIDEAEKLFKQHKRAQAAKLYRSVLKNDPAHLIALTQLGTIASLEGSMVEAKRYFAAAARKHPGATTYYNLGLVCYQTAGYDDAARHFKRAAELEPTPQRLLALAKAYDRLGDLPKVIATLEEAVARQPTAAIERMLETAQRKAVRAAGVSTRKAAPLSDNPKPSRKRKEA